MPPNPPSPSPEPELAEPCTPQELETIPLTDTDEDVPLSLEASTDVPKKTFKGRKLHPHRLALPGRPKQCCVADSIHFSASTSLVFTYLLLEDLVEADGAFVSVTLQCCLCTSNGIPGGTYHINQKTKKSTGSILSHFCNNHGDWWAEVEHIDNSGMLQLKKPTVKPVEVSSNI